MVRVQLERTEWYPVLAPSEFGDWCELPQEMHDALIAALDALERANVAALTHLRATGQIKD